MSLSKRSKEFLTAALTDARVSAEISSAIDRAGGSGVTIGTANGLSLIGQQISLALSTSSVPGALSAADWTAFNAKQTAGSVVTFSSALGAITQIQGPSDQDLVISSGSGKDLIIKSFDGSSAFRVKNGGGGAALSAGSNFHLPNGCPLEWNTDVGLSRTAASELALGNGANGDFTGNLKLANPTAAQHAATKTYVDNRIQVFSSAASSGGASTEALTVTGLLSTDTVISVSQKTPGGNNTALIGWSTLVNNGITGIWTANPGANAIVIVAVIRS